MKRSASSMRRSIWYDKEASRRPKAIQEYGTEIPALTCRPQYRIKLRVSLRKSRRLALVLLDRIVDRCPICSGICMRQLILLQKMVMREVAMTNQVKVYLSLSMVSANSFTRLSPSPVRPHISTDSFLLAADSTR